ncbi:uncharacterized protein LOC105398744 [Plutella xylostella]|uniref:uncharacterized protein LOC105398744 n=1 Tax=Plutella xylostella TaxID=51655 RepID=UPI00203318B4|nr:uncharacterized protein LOC105398744 [Plutella xylostella]
MTMSLQSDYYGGTIRSDFVPGDIVMYKKFVNKNKYHWTKGVIVKKLGEVVYLLKDNESDAQLKRHKNQIFLYKEKPSSSLNEHFDFANDCYQHDDRVNGEGELPVEGTPEQRPVSAAPAAAPAPGPARDDHSPVRGAGLTTMLLRNVPKVDYKKFF